MTDLQIIRESLIRSIAECQNLLESARTKLYNAKRLKDAERVITYRAQKKRIEFKIKELGRVLNKIEKDITKANFPQDEFIKIGKGFMRL